MLVSSLKRHQVLPFDVSEHLLAASNEQPILFLADCGQLHTNYHLADLRGVVGLIRTGDREIATIAVPCLATGRESPPPP